MSKFIGFDEKTDKLIPLTAEQRASLTPRQREAFDRFATAHEIVRTLPLSPAEQELIDACRTLANLLREDVTL